MIRTLLCTLMILVTSLALVTPTQAGFDRDDLGRLLLQQGFAAQWHNDGYYLVRHGGYNYRVSTSRDGSHLIFKAHLLQLNQQQLQHQRLQSLFQLHQQQGFVGQFQQQNQSLFFQHQVSLRNFQGHQLDNHFRSLTQTLDRHHQQWNPQHWARR